MALSDDHEGLGQRMAADSGWVNERNNVALNGPSYLQDAEQLKFLLTN